jgi:hypothetical protein
MSMNSGVDCESVSDANVRLLAKVRARRELRDVASRGDFKHQLVVQPSEMDVEDGTAVRILEAIETDDDEARIALLETYPMIARVETAMAIAVAMPASLTTVFPIVDCDVRGIVAPAVNSRPLSSGNGSAERSTPSAGSVAPDTWDPVADVQSSGGVATTDCDLANCEVVKDSDGRTPALSVRSDGRTPALSVRSDGRTPALSVRSDGRTPALSVRSDGRTPALSVRSDGGTPALSVRGDGRPPALTVHSATDSDRGVPKATELGAMPHDFLVTAGKPIGEGEFGSVLETWHWLLEVPLVLKKPKGERSLMGEWKVQARCAHPNVVRACYYDTDRYHLVLEKMSCSLATFLARQRDPLSDEVILRIATDVLRALLALRVKGVSHNDVKPDNILLITDENDCVTVAKLGDFGSAAGFEPTTRNEGKWKAATVGYLPPEARRGVWNGRFVRDLWSLCMSVCAMKFRGDVETMLVDATPDELDRFPARIFTYLDAAQPIAEKPHATQLGALLRAGLQVDPEMRADLIMAYVNDYPL